MARTASDDVVRAFSSSSGPLWAVRRTPGHGAADHAQVPSFSRTPRPSVLTALAAVAALVLGLVGLTGSPAYAVAEPGRPTTAAQACEQGTASVTRAKRLLRQAQRASRGREAKVARAQRRLETRRDRRHAACTVATGEQALAWAQAAQLALDELDAALLASLLPADAAAGLTELLAQVRERLTAIALDAGDGGTWGEFETLLLDVEALAPQELSTALGDLLTALEALEAPGDSAALVLGLLAGGAEVPAPLADLAAALEPLLAALAAVDPQAGPAQVEALVAGVLAALPGLPEGLDASAVDLGGLLDLVAGLSQAGLLDLDGDDPLGQLVALLADQGLQGLLDLLDLLLP